MLKRKPLSVAVATAVGVAATTGMPSAFAKESEMLEEVIVTGSRIKRADLDSASPVTVMTREDFEWKGVTDVGYLLQRMPGMAGSPIGTTTNNGGNGSVQIDLRGLGVNRTLTLVNGKRTVDGGDYQTIPATMIERVEILKDGASAVYGADAVAGVVNIITRQDYEGVSFEAYTTDFFDMDSGAQQSYNFIAGKSFDGGNFMFGAEFVDQEEAYQSDAPWDFFQDSYFIYPTGCESQPTAAWDGTAQGGCYPLGSSRIPESRIGFLTQGTYMAPGGVLTPHDGRTYNYAPVNYIQTPYERTNIFAQLNYEVFDGVQLAAEFRWNDRTSAQELAPQPYNSPTDPAHNAVFNGTAYSGISEQNYYLRQSVDAWNAANPGNQLIYEPVRDARRRMVETTRRFEQDVDQTQINVTLMGEINDMSWEVYFNRGWRDRTDVDYGQFSGPQLHNAMGPSADLDGDGSPECYLDINDPSSLIAGCVPMNFFGGPGAMTQDMIDYVKIDLVDTFEQETYQYGASLSGNAFELPAGQIGWAVGYEYRKEDFTYSPDSGKQLDAVTGNTGAGTTGGYSSDSFYAEAFIPVFDNGSQSLDITAGFRYDDFSTFGDDSTYQIGIEFRPTETLKLRATAGEVFRAPNIGESFGGQVDSFPTYNDPCDPTSNGVGTLAPGCGGRVATQLDTQLLARVGGNPDLLPEEGDTFTVGVVWTPDFDFGDLSVTVDYWDTELEGLITTLGVQYILDDCYWSNNAASCALINRREDSPEWGFESVLDAPLNAALSQATGVDLEIKTAFSTDFGDIEAEFLWAHYIDLERQAFPGDDKDDVVGRYAGGGQAWAEDKINYTVAWRRGDWTVSYLGEYIGELEADVSFFPNYRQDVDDQLYHDITVIYDLGDTGFRFSGGVTNVTDEEPPYIDFGFNASTDPSTYRMFGRGYYLRATWSKED
jgi:outer membrane receptor protein involved in Fe transport